MKASRSLPRLFPPNFSAHLYDKEWIIDNDLKIFPAFRNFPTTALHKLKIQFSWWYFDMLVVFFRNSYWLHISLKQDIIAKSQLMSQRRLCVFIRQQRWVPIDPSTPLSCRTPRFPPNASRVFKQSLVLWRCIGSGLAQVIFPKKSVWKWMLLFLCKSINSDSEAGGNQSVHIFSKQLGPDGISTRSSLKKINK